LQEPEPQGAQDHCICQECTCGKCHCPTRIVRCKYPNQMVTSYNQDFKEQGFSISRPFSPNATNKVIGGQILNTLSTYKVFLHFYIFRWIMSNMLLEVQK